MKLHKKMGLIIIAYGVLVSSLNAKTLNSVTQNNTTLVPLRTIGEELGATINFDPLTQKITIHYKEQEVGLKLKDKKGMINNEMHTLQVAPQSIDGTTYVPIRFIGEALGATVDYKNGVLSMTSDDFSKQWQLETTNKVNQSVPFKNTSTTVRGKRVTALAINMNDPKVKVKIATAGKKVTKAASIKSMAEGAKASINGTYFAAYNGDVPLPDGTIVSNGKVLHITDIGSTIGFTKDNKVLIDFVQTRVQGYVNDEETWSSYRVNRPTPDTSTTVIYTPEYEGNIPLPEGWSAVVCIDGKVAKIVTQTRTVPEKGFILTMVTERSGRFKVGDHVSYKTHYTPGNTAEEDWEEVVYALSAGPSLMINGALTGDPAKESFTEAKILNQVAQRSFIGTTKNNELVIGTVSASVSELKNIVKEMGLVSAMCLDGGASSGLYYNGSYLTSPGRNVSNSINFFYN